MAQQVIDEETSTKYPNVNQAPYTNQDVTINPNGTVDTDADLNTAPYTDNGFERSENKPFDTHSDPNVTPLNDASSVLNAPEEDYLGTPSDATVSNVTSHVAYMDPSLTPDAADLHNPDPDFGRDPYANPNPTLVSGGELNQTPYTDRGFSGDPHGTVVINETNPSTEAYPNAGIDGNSSHDPGKGATIGAVGGAIAGVFAGGPIGAIVGAVAGAAISGAAVAGLDRYDDDNSTGEAHIDPVTGSRVVENPDA